MKRKIIIFSVFILLCAGFYFGYKHYVHTRTENLVLRNITIDSYIPRSIDELCRKHKIPIVLEDYNNTPSFYAHIPKKMYPIEKITVQLFLNEIVPKKYFIRKKYRNVIHIISREFDSISDY
ncbi:MAG: hypothetical protein KKD35_04380, partial [Elusimicrobia bacterium]|nr:hypothetical protein [Elusimicrobiota bacterium]